MDHPLSENCYVSKKNRRDGCAFLNLWTQISYIYIVYILYVHISLSLCHFYKVLYRLNQSKKKTTNMHTNHFDQDNFWLLTTASHLIACFMTESITASISVRMFGIELSRMNLSIEIINTLTITQPFQHTKRNPNKTMFKLWSEYTRFWFLSQFIAFANCLQIYQAIQTLWNDEKNNVS